MKISIVDCRRTRCVVVEGKLVEPWTSELIAVCEKARADIGVRKLIVDLKSLTCISAEGEDVLLLLMAENFRIRSHGVFTREVVRQLSCRLGPSAER